MLLNNLIYVIKAVTGVFAGFLLLRFWMQAQRIRPPASMAQAIFKLTDWLVHPIRRVIPGFAGYDWSTLIGALFVALATAGFIVWLELPIFLVEQVFIVAGIIMAQWIIYEIMALLLLEVLFSWVNPNAPLAPFVRALNEPLLSPVRKLIPPIGGLDFSPMIILILLPILLSFLPSSKFIL
ncbi:MAG: YggT family protein [Burkholderiales bacterium]|nr:YggT family protein [Burkholderiales bacterium]MBI3729539.1 YggT family protein [Burkholderiales bacterium]